MVEYVHYVRIVEFQSWNNVKLEPQQPFIIGVSEPYVNDAEHHDTIVSDFYKRCMYAALGTCDMNVLRAVDEEGNVWHGLEVVIRHVKTSEEAK